MAIPRKRRGSATQHEKALERFYDTVLQAVLRHVNFEVVSFFRELNDPELVEVTIVHIWYRSSLNFKVVKAVVVASPGFVKDQFLDYLKQYSIKNDVKGMKEV